MRQGRNRVVCDSVKKLDIHSWLNIWVRKPLHSTLYIFWYMCSATQLHCNENSIYVFLFWKLRSLSPNFHLHVSVSDLYIPRIGPHIWLL